MRGLRYLIALLSLPVVLEAQGRLIPRPCVQPPPRPVCREFENCAIPVVPCPQGNPIVRTSSQVRAELVGRAVRYEVTETFLNRGPAVGEADYVFPIPAGAAFEALQLSINGEMVSGETLPADQARSIYESIVRRMRDPALVEWMGSGMLRTRIFPIAPGEEKKVVVRFQALARREGSAIRVDYVRGTQPTSTTPSPRPFIQDAAVRRFDPDSNNESADVFTLTYPRSDELGEAYSPTHTLRRRVRGNQWVVTAEGDSRELTILLPLRRPDAASISVLAHRPDASEGGYALIAITPPAAPARTTPRDVTFVVDVSGSMRGEKLSQAKAAGRTILASLSPRDRFRVVDFSTDVRAFRDGWTVASSDNLAAARRYLDNLQAEGSTNISGALEEALSTSSSEGRLPLVVFVTDGEPTIGERSPDAIAARVGRLRHEARLFTFGVSADVNTGLIEQLALEGRGTAQFVRSGESVERAVTLLATRLTSPVITDVRVRADGVTLRQLQPQLPTDLYAGQDLILLARYEGDGAATIRLDGQSADGPVHWSTPVTFPARDRGNPFVGRLWAAQRIGWLAAERRKNGGTPELDQEIKSLGEQFGIPTEFSSYLVVEPGMNVHEMTSDVRRRASTNAAPNAPMPASAGRASDAEVRFEAAKSAAGQRAATSLAAVDSMSAERDDAAQTKRIGQRIFVLKSGVWTDARYVPSMTVVRVKPYSPLYFALTGRLPGLADALVVGDSALVAGRSTAILIAADGLDAMNERELTALASKW
ncbi:MAG: VIT domain-containing protein [Gemmatimonadaceae bacterium]